MWLDHLRQDLRGAVRSATRYPIAALVAVVSLAAGIGATTVALTIRNVVFHKPPPLYQRADQLSKVQVGRPDRPMMSTGSHVPGTLFATWRDVLGSSIAAETPNRGVRDVRVRSIVADLHHPGAHHRRDRCARDVDPVAACVEDQSRKLVKNGVAENALFVHRYCGEPFRRRLRVARQPAQLADVADDLDDAAVAAHGRLGHDVAGGEGQELRVLWPKRGPHGRKQRASRKHLAAASIAGVRHKPLCLS